MKTERKLLRVIWILFVAVVIQAGFCFYAGTQASKFREERDYWKNQAMENARFNVAPPTQLKTKETK